MAKINITQTRSKIGSTVAQKRNLEALGLRRINHTVTHEDSPMIMGMIEKVKHLLVVEKADEKSGKPAVKKTVAAKPATKTAAKTAAKPAAKTAAKPAAKTAAKPAAKTAAKPATKAAVKPAAKPKIAETAKAEKKKSVEPEKK